MRNVTRIRPVALFACLATLGLPQGASAAGPVELHRAAVAATLQRHLEFLKADGAPGCVTGVARDGRLVAARADGLANLEHGIPLDVDMAFDIGSASKQFTATSVALLARRGLIDLDADIRRYLPEMPELAQPITVRQLIHHSAGLPDVYAPLAQLFGDSDGNLYPSAYTLEMAERTQRTNFVPGERFEYSNVGYLVLGRLVERVSGQSLRAFAEANIFGPLGMSRTHFHDDFREIVPKRASAYSLKPDGKTWEWRHSDFTVMGDGGVYSTLGDLARWFDNFSRPRLEGGQALVDLLLTPGRYGEQGATYRQAPIEYGFGLQMYRWKEARVIGHPGGWAGYGSAPYYFPDANLTVIALCNGPRREVIDAVLDIGAELAAGAADD